MLSSIEGQTPVGVWNALAKNPASWERAFIDTIETAKDDPALLGRVKSNLERMILRSDDPVKTLGAWEKTNPDALKWLFPDKRSLSIAKQNARVLNEYATSAYAKAEDAGFEQTGFALEAIKDAASRKVGAGMTPAQNMRQLMLDGGRVSPELRNVYRNAVITDIINSGLKNHPKYGTDAINPAALSKKIADMRKSGAYDAFLTQRDRQALSALQQFAKKSWKTGDSGSGLAVAAQLGRVRHGDIGALGNIWSSAKLARMITSTELPMQWVFSPTKQVGGVRQAYRSAMGSQASKEIFRAIRQGWLGQGLESQMLPTGEPSLPPELVNPLP